MLIKSKFNKKLITAAVCSFVLFINTVDCFGQAITWQREFPEYYGVVNRVEQTYDGGYIAVGEILISGSYKMRLIKFNIFGDTLWTKIIGVGSTHGNWVEETTDRGLIIGGSTDLGIGDQKAYLVKTDSLGNIQWQKTFSNSDLDQCHCVKQTPDGGYILSCRTSVFGSSNAMFIKTDQSGNFTWLKMYGDVSNQIVIREIQLLQDGYITSGRIGSLAASDVYVMKLDLNGDTLWTKRLGGSNSDGGFTIAVVPPPHGGFIIGGASKSFSQNGNANCYVIKINDIGNLEWEKTYSPYGGYDECLSVIYKPSVGYILAGTSDSLNNQVYKAKIRKIDFSGNIIFETSFLPGLDAASFLSAALTTDGGLILGGYGGNSYPDYYIVKADSLGFANPIGISNHQNLLPDDFALYQNYPNPFNSSTIVKFELKRSASIRLVLYDIRGREKIIIDNSYKLAGKYSEMLDFDLLNLSSGIYFYSLYVFDVFNSNFSATITKKMIYIK